MIEGSQQLAFKRGYKYQLAADFWIKTNITGYEAETDYISLAKDGWLCVKKGYAFDGPSGPTWDTFNSLRGAAAHDALYQLMRLGLLPQSVRLLADALFKNLCVEDGMNRIRAELWESAVNHLAKAAAKEGSERPILYAP